MTREEKDPQPTTNESHIATPRERQKIGHQKNHKCQEEAGTSLFIRPVKTEGK
jgi:hypothetical protein